MLLAVGVVVFASDVAICALIMAAAGVITTGMGGDKFSLVIGAGGEGTAAVLFVVS